MSRDAAQILVQPGFLIWAPTDLSAASPHSGTELGYTEDGIRLQHNQETRPIRTEETGVATQEIIYLGEDWRLTVVFLQWDNEIIPKLFPNSTAGGTSGDQLIQYPASTAYPGYKMSGQAAILAYSPTDLTNNKAVVFRKAIPLAAQEISFGSSQDSVLACSFQALPDESIGSGDGRYATRTVAIGDRRDISLT